MSSFQLSACKPPPFRIRFSPASHHFIKLPSTLNLHRCVPPPLCVFRAKGNDNDDASPWKSLEKAMSGLKKEKSLEDVLRQQMENKDYYDDGGNNPGGGGGGGGGGRGGGDGFGEPEDEGISGILDETFQVLMATMGFILLYVYIIAGDDVIDFFKDILRFLTRQRNNRFSNMFYQFGRHYQNQYQEDPYALEKAILNTPTWWDSPTKYKRMVKAYLASLKSDNEEHDSS